MNKKDHSYTAKEWNRLYSKGTPVFVCLSTNKDQGFSTKTRSEAWELGDGTPVVLVEGRIGGWGLACVYPLRKNLSKYLMKEIEILESENEKLHQRNSLLEEELKRYYRLVDEYKKQR